MSTQTRKTHRPVHTTVIGVVMASMLALTALLTGCQQKPDPEPPPAVVLPDVDTTKVYVLLTDTSGTRALSGLDDFNVAVKGGGPVKAYIVGKVGEGGVETSDTFGAEALIASDPSAVRSDGEASDVKTAAATGDPSDWFGVRQAYAATTGLQPSDPAYDMDKFTDEFMTIWQADQSARLVPAARTTQDTTTRVGQVIATNFGKSTTEVYDRGLTKASVAEGSAATWIDITPAELYALLKSDVSSKVLGFNAETIYFGLSCQVGLDGMLYWVLAGYNSTAAHPATNPDEQMGIDPPAWYVPVPAADTETPDSDDGPESGSSTTPGPAADDGETVPIDPIGVVNPGDIIEGDAGKALDGSIGWDPEAPIDLTDLPDVPVSDTIENPIVIGDDTFLVIAPPAGGDADVPDAKDPDAGADGPSWADAVELVPPTDGTDPIISTEPVTPPSWAVTVDVSDLYWQAVTAAVQRAYDEGGYQSALDAIAAIKGFLGSVVDEAVSGSRLGEIEAAANADKAAAEAAAAAVNNPGNTGGGGSGGGTSGGGSTGGGTSGGGGTGGGTSGGGGTGTGNAEIGRGESTPDDMNKW